MAVHGVGIDIVHVERIERLVLGRGEVFTRRWFTDAEVSQCDRTQSVIHEYASRLAAKEAVWKSLGLDGNLPVPWRSIEIIRESDGMTARLSGDIATAAAAAGVASISVTGTCTGDVVLSTALAWTDDTFGVSAKPQPCSGTGDQ